MRKYLTLVVAALTTIIVTSAIAVDVARGDDGSVVFSAKKKKPHVVINKRPACNTPGCDGQGTRWTNAQMLAAAPPLLVIFDIARRTSCDPAIARSTGPGDPGFDPNGPKTGNFLISAINRPGACGRQARR